MIFVYDHLLRQDLKSDSKSCKPESALGRLGLFARSSIGRCWMFDCAGTDGLFELPRLKFMTLTEYCPGSWPSGHSIGFFIEQVGSERSVDVNLPMSFRTIDCNAKISKGNVFE